MVDVDPALIAYRGEVELINAAWSLDSGRTVELRIAGDAYSRVHPFKRFQQKRNGRMGTRFHFAVANCKTGELVHRGDAMLAGWKDSSFTGQCITLWLDDESDRHPFAGYERRKNGTPGDLFHVALVEIGDDERPINQAQRERVESGGDGAPGGAVGGAPAPTPRPGATPAGDRGRRGNSAAGRRSKPSQQAHLMVTGGMFVRYLQETKHGLLRGGKSWTADLARAWVKQEIQVESLSEIDRDSAALRRFEDLIRKPFARWNNQEPDS